MPVIPYTENNAVLEYDSDVPPPPQAHFDADMIAAAQPVEPLTNPARPRRQTTARRLLHRKFWLLAALSFGLLLTAAVVGMLLGLQDGYAESRLAASEPEPSVLIKSVDEAPKVSATTLPMPARSRTRRSKQQFRAEPAVPSVASIEMSLNDRPVARKVGEIFSRSRKEDRKAPKRWRRQNDDDH
jgi:hypothetical protein